MPLQKRGTKEMCISYNYKEMLRSGRPKEQAQAASLNFCGKAWGSSADKSNELLVFLKVDLEFEMESVKTIKEELAKTKEAIEMATSPKIKGDFNKWCKRNGHIGVSQESINAAAEAGGKAGRMALFTVNVSKGKYYYPSKKRKK